MDEVAKPVQLESASEEPYSKEDIAKLIAELNDRPFHIQAIKTKFLDATLKDSTVGTSGGMMDATNPIKVQWEVNPQKDFFRKLKFKYLEQEAKSEFTHSIVGETPRVLAPRENDKLEISNASKKAQLKQVKADLEGLTKENEALGKDVSASYAEMVKETKEVSDLDKEIRELELEFARLRSKYPLEDRITIEQAETILDNQISDMQNMAEDQKAVSSQVEAASAELARTAKEVQRMGRERDREEARAREAREGAEKGDRGVDELCRWYTSAISVYKGLNGVKSMQPLSDTDILLEYILTPESRGREELTDGADAVKIVLSYDPETKTLARAKLLNHIADIEESVAVAVSRNDVPGLIADILARLRSP